MVSGGVLNLEYPDYCYVVRQEVPTKCPQDPRSGLTLLRPRASTWNKETGVHRDVDEVLARATGTEQSDSSMRGQKTKAKWK